MSTPENGGQARTPRLVRTRRGRMIGGVCSGLGDHFGVDPILLRIAFVGVTLFAGVGFWLYLAILLLVPEEGASRAPVRLARSSWRIVLGAVVVIVALAIAIPVISHAALGSAWGFGVGIGSIAVVGAVAALVRLRLRPRLEQERPSADLRLLSRVALWTAVAAGLILIALAGGLLAGLERHIAAWAVVAAGAGLALSAFTRARWLALPAIAFALSVTTVAAAHVDLHGGLGERSYRPHSLAELRRGYELGAGRLEIDLRSVSFPPGDTPLRVRLGVGELVVLVSDEVCVATRARIGGGFVGALDRDGGGLDVDWANRPAPPRDVPRVVLEGRVGLGAMFVVDRSLEGGFQAGFYGTNAACRPRTAQPASALDGEPGGGLRSGQL
jgi:phage shock protein PspC (stress-responsive transcriptional regulator)